MSKSTYIQKLVVGDILTGIENKSIYKVITPRVVKWNENDKSKRWVENDKQLHEWHFVDKSFKDLPKELTKNATEINKVTITDSQYNWICYGQILTGEHFFE
tara:strand:- start:10 stop:315 length:306 start_codon:yes stop_codon:yes gene_type:complete